KPWAYQVPTVPKLSTYAVFHAMSPSVDGTVKTRCAHVLCSLTPELSRPVLDGTEADSTQNDPKLANLTRVRLE
ncbi:hypothetical protein, partial [Xanthomonas arboricola]|uniref:hypothetical protein n=1 Tax=Xanthomonas arboricola TaxID=56448 RepID=UPI001955B318